MSSLAYVTVDMLDRRLDVSLPSGVPVGEVLPTLLRAGGPDLAARGQRHGGWSLRRADGAALVAAQSLQDQGVRDGEVLFLALNDVDWPEPVVDDVANSVARWAASDRWLPHHGRLAVTALAAALAVLTATAISRSETSTVALMAVIASVALLSLGFLRMCGDLAILGMPYAMAGAATLGGHGYRAVAATGLAVGIFAAAALTSPQVRRSVFIGTLAWSAGVLAAAVVWRARGAADAATVLVGYSALVGVAAPSLAVRIGGLSAAERAGAAAAERLGRAVTHTDEVLSGLTWACPVIAATGATALASAGRWPTWVLLSVVAVAHALRARLYHRVSPRLAMLVAGTVTMLPAAAVAGWRGAGGPALLVISLLVPLAGLIRPSPYLIRMAEMAEVLAFAAVVPAICLNLGLFGQT